MLPIAWIGSSSPLSGCTLESDVSLPWYCICRQLSAPSGMSYCQPLRKAMKRPPPSLSWYNWPLAAVTTFRCAWPSRLLRSVATKVRPSWLPSRLRLSTKMMPPLPGRSVQRPASSPAAITERLAAATIASLVRTAHGPSHIEVTAVSVTSTSASSSTGRSRPAGPMPEAASTYISLSRYIRPSAISTPMKPASGSRLGRPSSMRKPSTWNITLGGKLPLATCCSTCAKALPVMITSSTTTVAKTVCASSRRK